MAAAPGDGRRVRFWIQAPAYWPLTRPLVPRDAENANLATGSRDRRRPACFDVGRILRPPATWNHKHRPPRPVALLRLEPARFDPDAVLARAPGLDRPRSTVDGAATPALTAADSLLRIPPAVYVESLIGRRPGRDGKVRCPFHDATTEPPRLRHSAAWMDMLLLSPGRLDLRPRRRVVGDGHARSRVHRASTTADRTLRRDAGWVRGGPAEAPRARGCRRRRKGAVPVSRRASLCCMGDVTTRSNGCVGRPTNGGDRRLRHSFGHMHTRTGTWLD